MENRNTNAEGTGSSQHSNNAVLAAVLNYCKKAETITGDDRYKEAELFMQMHNAPTGLPKALAFNRWKKFILQHSS